MKEPLIRDSFFGEEFPSEESVFPTEQRDLEDVFTDLQPVTNLDKP